MNDKHARSLWYTVYQALLQALTEPTRWSLSVKGYNKMCLAFHEENDAAEFFKAAAVELRSKGLLFKDERTKQWINDPISDSESDSTFSESDKEETMVLYDAPGEMDQEAISASLQSAGFSISRLSRMGCNPGTPHGAARRLTCTGLLGRSGCTRMMQSKVPH